MLRAGFSADLGCDPSDIPTDPGERCGVDDEVLGLWRDSFTSVGAEQTSTGYEVARKVAGVDLYMIWNVDSSGNYISFSPTASGTGTSVESAESLFHQDLNGDGVIGVRGTVIDVSVSEQSRIIRLSP